MKIAVFLGSSLLMLLGSWAVSSPTTAFAEKNGFRQLVLEPFSRENYAIRCKGKESTRIIVYGQGSSPMAVYVFDTHGNCVARDDFSTGGVSDDLALEWFSAADATYDVEIRNLGRKSNTAEIAIR